MKNWQKLIAGIVLIAIAYIAYMQQGAVKQPTAKLTLAKFVDENLNYIESNNQFDIAEDLYFILETENLSMRNGTVSYKLDAEITNLSETGTEKTYQKTLAEETKRITNNIGKLNIVGSINLSLAAKTGTSKLKITLTDKHSGKTTIAEKAFRVEKWEPEAGQ